MCLLDILVIILLVSYIKEFLKTKNQEIPIHENLLSPQRWVSGQSDRTS